jgi:hypothetical protein
MTFNIRGLDFATKSVQVISPLQHEVPGSTSFAGSWPIWSFCKPNRLEGRKDY